MYEERKNTFSVKEIILQLILVVLFIFVMIWLFPTKDYLKENYVANGDLSEEISEQLQALYGRLFADNVESMSVAAQGYFTTPRLPKKVGDSVTLTLEEMLEKKLVLEFKDSNNEKCDVEKSYVKLTKMDDEYQMKVQLTCSDYSDYIIVYMGCYDYCDSAICQKEETKPIQTVTPTPDKDEPKPTPTVNYKYKYRKITQNTWSDWSNWSDWSTTKVTANDLTQVEIKREKVIKGYEQKYTIVDYKTEKYTEKEETVEKVLVGTTKESQGVHVLDKQPAKQSTSTKTETINPTKTTTKEKYGEWKYVGYVTETYTLRDTNTTKYVYQSQKTVPECDDICKNVTYYTYKKYTRSYTEASTTYSCPTGYTKSGSGANTKCTKTVPSGGLSCSSYGSRYKLVGSYCVWEEELFKDVPVYQDKVVVDKVVKTKKVPVYGYVDGDPIYETVTYYRYRTRKQLTVAGVDYKWSSSANDKSLLDAGYEVIGKEEV